MINKENRTVSIAPLSRRAVLRGGGFALGLPLLDAMLPRRAFAAGGPRRVVFFFMPHGIERKDWNPSADGGSMTLPYTLQPLEPFKNRLTVIRNVRQSAGILSLGNPHLRSAGSLMVGRITVGDGWGTGVSVDRYMGTKVAAQAGTRFPSLQVGVVSTGGVNPGAIQRFLSYDGERKPVTPTDSPKDLFNRLFGGAAIGTGPTAMAAARREQDKRTAMLDFALDDMRRLRAKLGGVDRARLDEHLTAASALEKQIVGGIAPAGAGPACVKPAVAPASGSFAQDGQSQSELVAMALACDLTRVVTLQWACGQSELNHSFLGNGIGHAHHWMSHYMSGGPAQLRVIQRFHIQKLANLAAMLDKMKEGDRSVLDNTAIVLMSEIAEGPSHSFVDMPFLVLGGLGGAVKSGGTVLDGGNRAQNDLWVSLLNAMGVADAQFGDPKLNKGPLPGLMA